MVLNSNGNCNLIFMQEIYKFDVINKPKLV